MIKFGPSGNSKRFYDEGHKSTVETPKWVNEQGLNVFEYSFGRGINISVAKANEIAKQSKLYGVEISVHAPYYINLANPSDDMANKSFDYIIDSCKMVNEFGGKRVVYHPATVGKLSRGEAVALTLKRTQTLVDIIKENKLQDFLFCPETMGKINQIGDVQEVVEMCKLSECFVPTIDFGHINARTYGGLKTQDDYDELLQYVVNNLGYERANNMHVHFSKIEYSTGGEVRHLTFQDSVYGPEFLPLAYSLKKYNLHPVIICESDGTQADDAMEMKRLYESI